VDKPQTAVPEDLGYILDEIEIFGRNFLQFMLDVCLLHQTEENLNERIET
jgi:hypothetical protein